jgi:DNA polymerase III gamma/tau subunit
MNKSNNLAIQLMPKSFDEIYGHDHIIQEFKIWIEEDTLPPGILIAGDPGTGKGTLVHNLIRTTLCLNRKPNESINCGKCAICKKMDARKTTPENNVMWIQVGNKSTGKGTIDSQIEEALEYANRPPNGSPLVNLGSKYHKFIVIDEIQSIKQPLLDKLLFILELESVISTNRVTFILITMNESYLESKNPISYKALVGRMGKGYFKLHKASDIRLHEYCHSKLNIESESIRNILVESAKGSYRDLIANYERISGLPELTPKLVELKLGLASRQTRAIFWRLFSNANNATNNNLFKTYWDTLKEQFGEVSIVRQLLDDLGEIMCHTQVPSGLIKGMVEFLRDPTLPANIIIFAPYQGSINLSLTAPDSSTSEALNDISLF